MKKNRPDLDDTQEIKIPTSSYDYGDGFDSSHQDNSSKENLTTNNTFLKKIDKRKILIISICGAAILVITIVICCVIFSINGDKKDENISTTLQKTEYTQNSTIENFTNETKNYEISENTNITTIPTESTTEPETTTAPTSTANETTISKTEPTTILEETPTETEENITKIQKSINVSDIIVAKIDDSLFVPKITGTFSGYSPEELLEKVKVTTTSGTPQVSHPYFSDNSSFTFNLTLDGCEGELHIHLDSFDFYQDISSFPD